MDGKRKLATDDIIAQALEEEGEKKRLKKNAAPAPINKVNKGLSVSEVEATQGGAVKEGLVTAAQRKRALQRRRKGKNAGDDTDMPADVEEAEELLDRDEDDGVKLEPFNLAQERAEGYFDDGGHYVENKKDDAEETDAWLGSEDAAVVSDAVRRQIQERQQRMATAEAAPEMTMPQMAALQRDIAAILLPGESVTRALQRLGKQDKRPAGKRTKDLQPNLVLNPDQQQVVKQQFEKLTEAASSLMDSGEHDIYSQKREYLERCAAQFAPEADMFGDDDDMFADNSENNPQQAPPAAAPTSRVSALSTPRVSFSFPEVMGDSNGSTPRLHSTSPNDSQWQPQQQAAQYQAPSAAADQSHPAENGVTNEAAAASEQSQVPASGGDGEGAAAADGPQALGNGVSGEAAVGTSLTAEAEVDYQSWPIKELRRFLTERGLDFTGIVEKSELAAKVKQAASQGPEGQAHAVPVGYAYDPSSGYHYNADSQMYFDSTTGGYYSDTDKKWYLYDGSAQQFVEWEQTGS